MYVHAQRSNVSSRRASARSSEFPRQEFPAGCDGSREGGEGEADADPTARSGSVDPVAPTS